jgi:hypothetical protein
MFEQREFESHRNKQAARLEDETLSAITTTPSAEVHPRRPTTIPRRDVSMTVDKTTSTAIQVDAMIAVPLARRLAAVQSFQRAS